MKITTCSEEFLESTLGHDPFSRAEFFEPASASQKSKRKSEFEMLSVEEAAQAIHPLVKENSIYQLIKDGSLRAKKIGSRFFISRNSVQEYLDWHDPKNPHDYTREKTKMSGSLSIKDDTSGQDAVSSIVKKLKKS
ncbi:MAG: helix-turn-helix domain-containing protein [Pseudomonadota bacterium]